jgi:hypothetical protein
VAEHEVFYASAHADAEGRIKVTKSMGRKTHLSRLFEKTLARGIIYFLYNSGTVT